MRVVDDTPKLNIFSLELSKTEQLNKEFLDFVCQNNYGVRKNSYWIFNSNLNIYENGDIVIPYFNKLLYNSQLRGFSQLMITEEKIKEEDEIKNPTE